MSIKSFIKNKNNNIDDVLQNKYLTGKPYNKVDYK